MSKAKWNQHESNAMNQSIVPSVCTFTAASNQFEVNMMGGNMKECKFYVPDVTGDTAAFAFRVAYNKSTQAGFSSCTSFDDKELCCFVGSMLCSVVPGFRNSIELALNGAGIRPCFVSLPSQARENNTVISRFPELDWSSILVVFGYCILLLFNIDNTDQLSSHMFLLPRINEMREKVRCSPRTSLLLPFTQRIENAVRTMLGTLAVRTCVINFLMNSFNHPDPQTQSLCHYLSYKLSWSGQMQGFSLMNKWLVKTNSPVLSDSRVILEADHFEETINVIATHTYPQYFNHLCSTAELFHLDISRFPILYNVAVALEKKGHDNFFSGPYNQTVKELVSLHQTSMAQRGVSTTRSMPTVPGI